MENKTVVISKWNRIAADGKMLKQVVVKTDAGKNQYGKQIYHSPTRHVPV